MRSSILSVWLLVFPGVFLQLIGSGLRDLALFCLGTAAQGIGLWIHCQAKGRNRWWALLALAPPFGWVGAVYLRSRAQLEARAREKTNRTRVYWVGRAVKSVCVLMLLGVCAFPRAALFDVYLEGNKLIQLLESYTQQHGVYPDTLEELGVPLEYTPDGWRGIRYRPILDGNEFFLTCFVARLGSTAERETYDSRTGRWRAYN